MTHHLKRRTPYYPEDNVPLSALAEHEKKTTCPECGRKKNLHWPDCSRAPSEIRERYTDAQQRMDYRIAAHEMGCTCPFTLGPGTHAPFCPMYEGSPSPPDPPNRRSQVGGAKSDFPDGGRFHPDSPPTYCSFCGDKRVPEDEWDDTYDAHKGCAVDFEYDRLNDEEAKGG